MHQNLWLGFHVIVKSGILTSAYDDAVRLLRPILDSL